MIVRADALKKAYKYLIFDFDGTVANTQPGIALAMGKAMEFFGKSSENIDFRKYIGPPIQPSFAELVGAKNSKKAVELYRKFYDEINAIEMCSLYDGIVEVLEKLSGRFIMAIASSKHEPHLIQSVKNLGIEKYFKMVFGRNDERPLKHLIVRQLLEESGWDKNLCLMIGDTKFDINGARENGIDVLSVTYGYESKDNLLQFRPDAWADSTAEIVQAVCKE